jgi:hypothetical protein
MKNLQIQTTINMLTIFFCAIVLIAMFFYLSDTTINFSPFKIRLETPLMGLGWVLLGAGTILITTSAHQMGYKQGAHETIAAIEKGLDSIQKAKEDSTVKEFKQMEKFHDSLNSPLNEK